MAKIALGCEPVVGSLTPSKKREYRLTNRLQEGKRPLYAVVFNFIDSRYFNVFATVGGNRVCYRKKPLLFFWFIFILLGVFLSFWRFCFYGLFLDFWVFEVCDAKIRALVKLLCGWWCKDCSFVMDAFMLYRNRFLGSKCRFFFLLSLICRLFFWKRILYLRNLGIW